MGRWNARLFPITLTPLLKFTLQWLPKPGHTQTHCWLHSSTWMRKAKHHQQRQRKLSTVIINWNDFVVSRVFCCSIIFRWLTPGARPTLFVRIAQPANFCWLGKIYKHRDFGVGLGPCTYEFIEKFFFFFSSPSCCFFGVLPECVDWLIVASVPATTMAINNKAAMIEKGINDKIWVLWVCLCVCVCVRVCVSGVQRKLIKGHEHRFLMGSIWCEIN